MSSGATDSSLCRASTKVCAGPLHIVLFDPACREDLTISCRGIGLSGTHPQKTMCPPSLLLMSRNSTGSEEHWLSVSACIPRRSDSGQEGVSVVFDFRFQNDCFTSLPEGRSLLHLGNLAEEPKLLTCLGRKHARHRRKTVKIAEDIFAPPKILVKRAP